MNIESFFTAVLPSDGIYVVAYKDGDRIKQRTSTWQGVLDFCYSNQDVARDCWFAVASYKLGWHEVTTSTGTKNKLRTQDNANLAKALWLDIDVGDNKPYKTRQEASAALSAFIRKLGLPRPWVVGSGAAGLHLYFEFDEAVTRDQWEYLATRLKQACKQEGIHADPSRTADIASIMRCPLTWNTKGLADGTGATQVQVLIDGRAATYESYATALSPYQPKVDYTNRLPTLPANIPQLHTAVPDVMTKYFRPIEEQYPKRNVLDLLKGCEQLRNQNGASEPVWRGMLATVRHCEHGRFAAHQISKHDPRYNAIDTDEKLNYLEENSIPPFTCETFNSLRPEVCARCPLNGLINSPISVPVPKPDEPKKEEPEQPAEAITDIEDTGEYPKIETRSSRVDETGCWVKTRNAEGDWQWRNIYAYPVYPLQRVRGRTAKGETCVSYIFRKYRYGGYDDIQIAGSTLMGQTLNAALGDFGFLLTDKERKLMAGLLIDLLKETESTVGEVQTTDRLGWNDTFDTFLLGNKLYKTDGKVFEISVSGKAKPFSDHTVPVGKVDLWRRIAGVYNKEGLEWGQAVVASAFASPLMPLGALEKAALLFITGEKGVGKSTALLMASSVFGNPERLMFNKMDTMNSRIHKLGIFSNITAAFDEMTDMTPREASEFAYTLTQGRGKDRMGAGGESMLLNTTYWSCLPVMSANDSIINSLAQHSVDPTAQMSRVLEVKATDINAYYTADEVEENERLVRQLPQNYGLAGDVYMRYITANKEEVLDLIYQVEKQFKRYAELNSNYRFWSYMCTRMVVGLMIAKKLELVDYDIGKFFTYLVNTVKKARGDIEGYRVDPESSVAEFLNASIPNRLVVTHKRRPTGMADVESRGAMNDVGYVVHGPAHGRAVTVRVELDSGDCIISISAIKEWCSKTGMPYMDFIKRLQEKYPVKTKRTQRELGAHTMYRSGGKTTCVVINTPADFYEPNQEENL